MFSLNLQKKALVDGPLKLKILKDGLKFTSDDKVFQEIIVKLRSIAPNLHLPLLLSSSDGLPIDEFEEIVEILNNLTFELNEHRSIPRAIYPAELAAHSSLILTDNFSRVEKNVDNGMFIDLLRNAYANDLEKESGGTGIIRCNLILNDLSQIHSFEFESEREYWQFLGAIKKGISNQSVSLKGKCKYLSTQTKSDNKDNKNLMRARFGVTITNTSTFTDNYEFQGTQLSVVSSSVDQAKSVNFSEVIALALTLDYTVPAKNVLGIGVRLPPGYIRIYKTENSNINIQVAITSEKRTILPSVQIEPNDLPFSSTENHYSLVPVDFEGNIYDTKEQKKESSPMPSSLTPVKTPIRSKSTWEIEIYNNFVHGKLLGKKTLSYNPFLDTVSFKSKELDIYRITNLNSIESSPISRTRSMKFSLSPVRKESESLSPKLSPKKPTSLLAISTDVKPVSAQTMQIFMFKDPKSFDVEILEKQFNKALRVHIRNAVGINGSLGKSPPAVYCTVYLVGENGTRLTSNHTDVRTEPVKSFNPEWNKEILLQDSKLGIEDVQSVMILLRDASSGILKHKHIGQVLIPIDCFLPQDEASFCLPLEPSYRMDGMLAQQSFIGEINLTTQMVNVEVGNDNLDMNEIYPESTSAPKQTENKRKLLIRTKSVELGTGQLNCTLFRALPGQTWWPFKILYISNGKSSKQNEQGFTYASPVGLILKVVNHSLGGSKVSDKLSSTNLSSCAEGDGSFITIPYNQVESVIDVSESCILLKYQVHMRQNLSNPISVEILIGPCPAIKFRDLISLHTKYLPVREGFNRLQYLIKIKSSPGSVNPSSNDIPSADEEFVTLSRSIATLLEFHYANIKKEFLRIPSSSQFLMEKVYLLSLNNYLRIVILSKYFTLCGEIPAQLPSYSYQSIENLLSKTCDELGLFSSPEKTFEQINEKLNSLLNVIVDFLRDSFLFSSRLVSNFHDFQVNSQNSDLVAMSRTVSGEEYLLNNDLKSFIEHIFNFSYDILRRVFDYYAVTNEAAYFKNNSAMERLESKLLKQKLLSFFIEKNDFLICKILQFMEMYYLKVFEVQSLNNLVDLCIFPGANDLISWFYAENHEDMKNLILKLFHPKETGNKKLSGEENLHPWPISRDFQGFYISPIPASIAYELDNLLSFFVNLHQPTLTHQWNFFQLQLSSYQRLGKKILLIIYNSWLLAGREYYTALQLKDVEVFNRISSGNLAKMRLGLESPPNSVLQIVSDSNTFLVSALNDCLKITNEFIPKMKNISDRLATLQIQSTGTSSKSNLPSTTNDNITMVFRALKDETYEIIVEQLMLLIVKSIFSTIVSPLLYFEEHWFNDEIKNNVGNTTVVQVICERFMFFYQQLKSTISSPIHLLAIVYFVEETIIMRYFLLIREQLVTHISEGQPILSIQYQQKENALSLGQIRQLQNDCNYLKSFFTEIEKNILGQEIKTNSDNQNKERKDQREQIHLSVRLHWSFSPVSYFEHMVTLLVEPKESFAFNTSLRFLIGKYDSDAINYTNRDISLFLDFFLLHVILPIRSFVNGNEEKKDLYDYFIKILDGNHEDIYRQTNSYVPLHLEFGNHQNSKPVEVEEEIESHFFKRDLFWRTFSSDLYLRNKRFSTEEVLSPSQQQHSNFNMMSAGDHFQETIQNAFQGLFQLNSTLGKTVNSSKQSVPTSTSRKRFELQQANLIVENIRQTATEFIQKINFQSGNNHSNNNSDKHSISNKTNFHQSRLFENEKSLFLLLGLEFTSVLAAETINSLNSKASGNLGPASKINENDIISKKSSITKQSSQKAESKISTKSSSVFQTPIGRGESGKGSIFSGFFSHPDTARRKIDIDENNPLESKQQNSPSQIRSLKLDPTLRSVSKQTLSFFNEGEEEGDERVGKDRDACDPTHSRLSVLVQMISVNNLKTDSVFGTKPSPYIYFLLPKEEFKVKTSVLQNMKSGTYPDILKIPFSTALENASEDRKNLEVLVYHKDPIRRKVLIGYQEINLFQYYPKPNVKFPPNLGNGKEIQIKLHLKDPAHYLVGANKNMATETDARFGEISFQLKLVTEE